MSQVSVGLGLGKVTLTAMSVVRIPPSRIAGSRTETQSNQILVIDVGQHDMLLDLVDQVHITGDRKGDSSQGHNSDTVVNSKKTEGDEMTQMRKYASQIEHYQTQSERIDVNRIARLVEQFCQAHDYTHVELARALGIDHEVVSIVVAGYGSSQFARHLLEQIRERIDHLTNQAVNNVDRDKGSVVMETVALTSYGGNKHTN